MLPRGGDNQNMTTNEARLAAKYDDESLEFTIAWMSDGRRLGAAQARLLVALLAEKAKRS